ncbi:MAG: RNA polymerase sigma factor [Ruminococcaceae bacterium]|nr:RNA polymerase sigma factor [Oscillospiraceae bacterium]
MKVIKYRHKFVGASKEKVKALIYLYTKCSAWDFIKKRDKFQFISYNNVYEDEHGNNYDLELSDNIDILRDIISGEAQDSIRMAVERLKHPAKEIIQLKFWEDHSNVEIAELLGINPSTISTIISRTVAKLKVEMEEYANE